MKDWDIKNLYGSAMSQKLPENNFEWIEYTSQFNEDFIMKEKWRNWWINYDVENDEEYIFKSDVQYPEKWHDLHSHLQFLPWRIKMGKVEKLVAKLHDKTEYVVRIRNLKQALNHGLVFKKVNRVIKFNQNAWLKPYIDMNKDLGTKVKNDFEKYLF